jgi:hypothetical protein
MPKKTALTAVKKLELSKIDSSQIQRELMGDDLDLEKLVVYLKSQILFDTTDRVIDVQVNRTIDGASTIDVSLNDYDRAILRSWALNAKLDVEIDGMWFRLVSCSKSATDDILQLTFEQREIALLRSYPKPDTTAYTIENAKKWVKWANRDKTTRAQFVLNLVREVKEIDIPVVIPYLQQVQLVAKSTDLTGPVTGESVASSNGIPADYNQYKSTQAPVGPGKGAKANTVTVTRPQALTSKHVRATRDQIQNANTILTMGQQMGARRKVLVCGIMTAIQESNLTNLSGGDGTSVGLFQQIDTGWGSYAERHDPATASRMFFEHCIRDDASQSGLSFNDLCQTVQGSGHPDLYGQWRWEAERFANAFGVPPGGEGNAVTGGASGTDSTAEGNSATANLMGQAWTNSGADNAYFYYRGIPPTRNRGWWKREDNWTCIQRLASEVGWRAFFIGGVFYFLDDNDLFKTQPIATVAEDTPGVMGIGFDYDVGRKGATVDLPCEVGLWLAPPGSVIVLESLGPLDGRWLVNSFSRSLFDSNADIALTKPQPKLPEPAKSTVKMPTWGAVGAMSGSSLGVITPAEGAPGTAAAFGGTPGMNDGSRKAVVAVAEKAVQVNKTWHYHYPHEEGGAGPGAARPIPNTLWSAQAHSALDCSAFATLCYKEAGCADPNNANYDGSGNTGTLVANGVPVNVPKPGDLIFYHGTLGFPGHVTVYIGGGMVASCGSEQGVITYPINGDGPLVAMRSYLP